MLTLKTISTECLLRNRSRIRAMWREIPAPPDGAFPMDRLYDAIVAELRDRGFYGKVVQK